ncbi:MAG: DsrE/DsrF/DrsH-like family protein [bacterium]
MSDSRSLCIVLHAGEYDRVSHALSIAGVAAAMGKEVHLLFTYWALKRLVRGETDKTDSQFIEEAVAKGYMKTITEAITTIKKFGTVHIYACSGSMALMNISQDELINEVDRIMGLPTFISLWEGSDVIFI